MMRHEQAFERYAARDAVRRNTKKAEAFKLLESDIADLQAEIKHLKAENDELHAALAKARGVGGGGKAKKGKVAE
jgi:prefoldin subunit 5